MSRHLPFMEKLSPLQPDRPASTYQLSFSQFQHNRLKFKIQQTRVQELLQQIDQLSAVIRRKQQQHQKQVFKHREQILLMGIQITRVRAINTQYANTLRSTKDQWKNLQNIYSLKFQELKQNLRKQFQSQLEQTKIQTKNEIQKMRQLYIQKINAIMTEQRHRQEQLQGKGRQVQDKIVKIDVYQMKINEAQSKIKILSRKVNEYEQNIESVVKQSKLVASKLQNQKRYYQQQISSLSSRNSELNSIKDELHQQILSMKQNLQHHVKQLQDQITKLDQNNKEKATQNEKLKYKCFMIQNQLNQFKNRKTQHRDSGGRRMVDKQIIQYDSPKTQEKIVSNQIKKEIKMEQATLKIQQLSQNVQALQSELRQKNMQLQQHNLQIESQNKQLQQQSSQLTMISNVISQKQKLISQKQAQIQKGYSLLSEKDKQILALKQKNRQITKEKQKQKEKDKEQSIKNINKSMPPNNNASLQAQKKLLVLEQLVQNLNYDWGLKQKNQNGIYRQIHSTYIGQIQNLKKQNKQLQQMIQNQKIFIQSMAKAKFQNQK